jgi:hypothetical protein
MTHDCLLTLIAAPTMEETLIDWLLMQDDISGFSSTEIYGHGSRSIHLSLLEQVTGRQKRVQMMIHTEKETATRLVTALKSKYPNTGLHYLITPIVEAGQI